jgi:hypothetical protein
MAIAEDLTEVSQIIAADGARALSSIYDPLAVESADK